MSPFADPHQPSGGRDLQILTTCPLCHAAFNPLKTQIVAEREDAHLLYLQCRQCGSAVVALVTNGAGGLNTVGAVTDLTSRELPVLQDREPIGMDDVIELHAWLGRSDHSFVALQPRTH